MSDATSFLSDVYEGLQPSSMIKRQSVNLSSLSKLWICFDLGIRHVSTGTWGHLPPNVFFAPAPLIILFPSPKNIAASYTGLLVVVRSRPCLLYIHCVSKKRHPFLFLTSYLVRWHPILPIRGRKLPQEVCDKCIYIYTQPTISRFICSYCTL